MNDSSPKKSDLSVRAASALVMLAVAALALWLGGAVWIAFVAAIAAVALWEWRALVYGFVPGLAGRTIWTIGGMLYIGFACAVLLVFRRIGIAHVLLPVLVTIATDTAAYFSGRTFGGPKIAPAISPSKTWAGLIGGMIGAALVASWWLSTFPSQGRAGPVAALTGLAMGAGLAIVAQAGDFLESWMKRRAGVKDSGSLIPGHGGALDRIDGMLAVSVVCGVGWLILVGMVE